MDAELTALAAAGAAALVQQMVADGWAQARDRVAGFFSRGEGPGGADDAVVGELDEARAELVAARETEDADMAADVQAEWRSRLRRRLAADPAAAAELRALLAELASEGGGGEPRGDVTYNTISGGVQHGTVIQAGKLITGHHREP
ncbi:hypothetical protein [Streptomyces sp. NPDC003032]